ncbi:MAG: FemAB family PEP-CTERM system-associated protein [Pseudomonadales bacterium]
MRVTVFEVDDGEQGRWNGYLERSRTATLYHRYEWRGLIRRVFGKHSLYLAARDADGRWAGVLPLVHMKSPLFGNFMVSMPYVNYGGAIADTPEVLQALVDAAQRKARELGCRHVEFRHDAPSELDLPVSTRKVTMLLTLPENEDALWSGFKPKLRAQIRRPEKAGAQFAIGGAELLREFYDVFAVNMRDLGTPVYTRRFFEAVLDTFSEARVGVVRMEGKPVASGLVLGYGRRLEIPWASSLRSHNKFSPNMMLYWRLLQWALSNGYDTFDFGRCTRDSGTYRFKRQWGAEEHPLFWYYWLRDGGALPELNADNPAFATLVALWRRLPVAVTRVMGPPIVKHLP